MVKREKGRKEKSHPEGQVGPQGLKVNRIMENALPTFLPPSGKQQESPVGERQEQ